MSKAQATELLRNLHTQETSIAKVEHEMGWNAAALVDQSRTDAIPGITAKPSDQFVGPIFTSRGDNRRLS
jgi:hypothetical protein